MGASQILSVPYALYADSSGTPGTPGPPGNDGVGITSSEIDTTGSLIITYSDGTVINAGTVVSNSSGLCPDGFISVNDQYCIEANEHGSTSWYNAVKFCDSIGGRLCTWGEFYAACEKSADGVLQLNDMTNNWEWLDDGETSNNGGALKVGLNTCENRSNENVSFGEGNFRCCYSRSSTVIDTVFLQETDNQILSISDDTISISNGNSIVLPSSSGTEPSGRYVGELYGGGIVFYVYYDANDGQQHGLIASLDDLDGGIGAQWGLLGTNVPNCESMTNGSVNTMAIMSAGGSNTDAAGLCANYNGGGYTDWYLPSWSELHLLATEDVIIDKILDNDGDTLTNGMNQETLDGFIPGKYWSSSEDHAQNAWYYHFVFGGHSGNSGKTNICRVRAIRAF